MILSLTLFISLLTHADSAFTASSKYQLTTILDVKGVIWGLDFLNENELLYTIRDEGKLYHYNMRTKKSQLIYSPKVYSSGQGGLLDVVVLKNGEMTWVYLTMSIEEKGLATTALVRGQWKKSSLENPKKIFVAKVSSDTTRHFGSRVVVDGDQLFMTIGDRGERDFAQKLTHHNGKILRLTLDGSPFSGNPFSKTKGALPEIWSYGHRNPQGIAMDRESKTLYSCEFGPRGGDELNLISKGKNYGWPLITYGREYWGPSIGTFEKEGLEQPLAYWTPSISPSGLELYSGDKIPEWKGDLFLANLSSRHLRRVSIKKGKVIEQESLFNDLKERIRQVRTGPDGALYFSTDSGKIIQVLKK